MNFETQFALQTILYNNEWQCNDCLNLFPTQQISGHGCSDGAWCYIYHASSSHRKFKQIKRKYNPVIQNNSLKHTLKCFRPQRSFCKIVCNKTGSSMKCFLFIICGFIRLIYPDILFWHTSILNPDQKQSSRVFKST